MGKRSNFERIEKDWYPTPFAAVIPLSCHLQPGFRFVEPCAGDRRLVTHLEQLGGQCELATDIEPQVLDVDRMDMFDLKIKDKLIITNPPWSRNLLHPMLDHFLPDNDLWLLFDADWVHTKQSIPYLPHLKKTVSVGRVKWIEDSKMTGKDNCQWYFFTKEKVTYTEFYGRI